MDDVDEFIQGGTKLHGKVVWGHDVTETWFPEDSHELLEGIDSLKVFISSWVKTHGSKCMKNSPEHFGIGCDDIFTSQGEEGGGCDTLFLKDG